MRKLDLTNYTFKVRTPDHMKLGEIIEIEYPFNMKDGVLNLMFHPDLRLNGAELVRQNMLAMKIEQADDFVLLEEAEYERVKAAIDSFKGFSRPDVELVRRVTEAPQEG